MDIHITPLKDLYIPTILEVVEIVKPRDLMYIRREYRGNIDKFLEQRLSIKYGNTCTVQGLTDRGVKVKSRSIGTLNTTHFAGEIHYNLKIVVNVCIPSRGVYIKCRIINFNDAFLLAENGPLLIITRRLPDVELKINNQIIIEIQNYRNIIKDNTIKVMGKFIKHYEEETTVTHDSMSGLVLNAPQTYTASAAELTKKPYDSNENGAADTISELQPELETIKTQPAMEGVATKFPESAQAAESTDDDTDSLATIVEPLAVENATEFEIADIPIGDRLPISFFSRSKDTPPPKVIADMPGDFRKILSNFYVIPGGITIEGHTYPSVEHWFQSQKYFYAGRPGKIKEFTKTNLTPKDAKKMGSDKYMKALKLTLDAKTWNSNRDEIMYKGILERYRGDPIFKKILDIVAREHLWLVHYDRSTKSHWGGKKLKQTGEWVGANTLGQIMMNIVQSHHSDTEAVSGGGRNVDTYADVETADIIPDIDIDIDMGIDTKVDAGAGDFVPALSIPDDFDNIKIGGEFAHSDIKVINIKGLNRIDSSDTTLTRMENEYMENYSDINSVY